MEPTEVSERRGDNSATAHQSCELVGVSVVYGGDRSNEFTVLEDINMVAEPGSITCIEGRSGSGKTTLLRVAAALEPPTSGGVRWGNLDITELPEHTATATRAVTVGYARQGNGLLPFLSAVENVLIGVPPHLCAPHDVDRAEQLLERLGLSARLNARPRTLSGGEAQRVVLARALIGQRPILLIDEPTAALDTRAADIVIDLLHEQAEHGRTVIVATHDNHVLQSADQLISLSG